MNLLFTFLLCISLLKTTHSADILPTKLQITILDEVGNVVEGAQVRLYKTEEDYEKERNQVGVTMKSDAKGRVTFSDLEPIEYYVSAEKGDLDNSGAGTKTKKLEAKRVNKVNIIIS